MREFAAIRVEEYKLVVNQDAVFKTTWHPRYEVPGELETMPQPSTLPGAVLKGVVHSRMAIYFLYANKKYIQKYVIHQNFSFQRALNPYEIFL